MGYYTIGSQPVFVSGPSRRRLNEEALSDKDAAFRVGSTMSGSAEAREADALRHAMLQREHDRDPERFRREWVRFDLSGEDAQANVWDLLFDYCCYSGMGQLADLRSSLDRLTDGYGGDAWAFPMGRVFAVDYQIRSRGRWPWSREARLIRVVVSTESVLRLVGELSGFVVVTDAYTLRCAKELVIFPTNAKPPDD